MTAAAETIGWQTLLRFEAHPDVWLLVVGVGAAYAVEIRRHVQAGGCPPATRTIAAFSTGLMLLWVAADWPIDDVGERSLLSVHMVQYLLLALAAPGLLLVGLPTWLVDRLLRPTPARVLARAIRHPVVAWTVVSLVLLVTHWNPVIELYLRNEVVHLAMHVVWVASGLALWWPVLSPLSDVPRLSPVARMGYLLVQSVIPTVPASFLTFADGPVFQAYARLPKPPGVDTIVDQQLAGLLMKVGGGFVLWIAIAAIFFRWSAGEERAAATRFRRETQHDLHDRRSDRVPAHEGVQ